MGGWKKKKDDTHTKTEKQIIIKEKKGKILTRTGTGRIEREKIFFNSREKFYLFFSGHKIAIDDIHHIKHRKKKKGKTHHEDRRELGWNKMWCNWLGIWKVFSFSFFGGFGERNFHSPGGHKSLCDEIKMQLLLMAKWPWVERPKEEEEEKKGHLCVSVSMAGPGRFVVCGRMLTWNWPTKKWPCVFIPPAANVSLVSSDPFVSSRWACERRNKKRPIGFSSFVVCPPLYYFLCSLPFARELFSSFLFFLRVIVFEPISIYR
jgi:hypothetical protein